MSVRILQGDCREVLAGLAAESVHCCVTSPPYWGLRDYGIAPTIWGGDQNCDHEWGDTVSVNATNHTTKARWNHTRNGRDELQPVEKRVSWLRTEVKQGQYCQLCGAWAGAHGLEPSIDLYIRNAVEIFRAVHRVLRPDGTLWLNLGDSYATGTTSERKPTMWGKHGYWQSPEIRQRINGDESGLKSKDLCGIPWRIAFALQADGWWLRQDIVWHKPNPMPESVTDRCTKAHEYLFLFAKGQWSGRPVKLANLSDDRGHLVRGFDGSSADSWAARFGVGFATSILNSAEIKQQLGGTALEPQVWQQSLRASGSISVSDLPPMHRLARYASRFLNADATAKEFLGEIHRIGLVLGERNDFLIRGCNTKIALPPSVNANGKGAVAVHDAGKIGEFDFVHGEVIVNAPTTCKYFFDAEAIAEAASENTHARVRKADSTNESFVPNASQHTGLHRAGTPRGGRLPGVTPKSAPEDSLVRAKESWHASTTAVLSVRNKRSVWTVPTSPFPEAHFATFPPDLIEPCIKAGTSQKGCCASCGAPLERVIGRPCENCGEFIPVQGKSCEACGHVRDWKAERGVSDDLVAADWSKPGRSTPRKLGASGKQGAVPPQERIERGWRPTCKCDAGVVPATVLDPFFGAGTTGLVSDRLRRNCIGIELNPSYVEMAQKRVAQDCPLFFETLAG